MRRIPALVVLLALFVPLARAEAPTVEEAVANLLLQEDGRLRTQLAFQILGTGPAPQTVEAAVREGWWWSDQAPKGEPTSWTRMTDDGVAHEIFAYVPDAYTPKRAWPVLVYLHGAVNRPEGGGGESAIERFRERADAGGFLLLAPSAQRGSEWWTPRGTKLVRDSLMDVKRRWRVDADRVAVTGFSDGGSGCFHLLAHDPEPYCCFLAFMGNPLATRIWGGPTWTTALRVRPVYAINGARDRLFPSETLRPFFDGLKDAGCDLTWSSEEDLGHDFAVYDRRWDEAHAFWKEHPRTASPKRIAWTASRLPGEGRFAWIEIRTLDEDAAAGEDVPEPEELEVPDFRRPRLGFRIDQEFEGPGIRVSEVEEDTPASEAGLEAGDVITKAGETEIPGFEEIGLLTGYLAGLQGKEGVFLVTRGEEEVEIRAAPRLMEKDRPQRPAVLGYDVAPGVVFAGASEKNEIEIQTRGVKALRLWLSRDRFDLDKNLEIHWNGRTHRVRPVADAAVVLSEAVRGGPGAPIYAAYVDLETP